MGDVYFSEFSRLQPDILERHLVRLSAIRRRVFYAVASGQCLNRELATRRRTNRDFLLHAQATVWIRDRLADPHSLAVLITGQDVRDTVIKDRYSNQEQRDGYKFMVKEFERAMKVADHKGRAGDLLNDEALRGTILLGRSCVYYYLIEKGWTRSDAVRFSMRDSFMFRDICARLCRVSDWAQAKGIEGQDSPRIDGEGMDIEYVVLASYCDRFLSDDGRNQRNDSNLRRLLEMAPRVREMRTI